MGLPGIDHPCPMYTSAIGREHQEIRSPRHPARVDGTVRGHWCACRSMHHAFADDAIRCATGLGIRVPCLAPRRNRSIKATADSLHAQLLEPQDVNTNQHRSSSIQCPNCQQTVFPSEDDYTEHHKKKHPEDRVQLAHPLCHSKQTN
ncbi:hypothetical protein MGG_17602 [Pyricularia oryzae 70-15]|uniref:Uncharacterized protein n=1 Tax=Pyricularia oryzae (strain 70-15 / ATCC MYA-4617 / FGSC 8958) TaxID=242507 RepID=G4NG42_PYRO7|nr:uncharacterized protein MGG_17602 [Pyricularia oryzae 70-15]EHA46999.1 hypothetical protein MGG_17602 [Pyricularia oryzae 70-15]